MHGMDLGVRRSRELIWKLWLTLVRRQIITSAPIIFRSPSTSISMSGVSTTLTSALCGMNLNRLLMPKHGANHRADDGSNNGMHPAADTLPIMFFQKFGARVMPGVRRLV